MPNYTNNLNLEKPLQSENYNIDIFNSNADKIDTAIQEVKGKVDGLELTAQRVSIADSTNKFEATNVEDALLENKTSISNLQTKVNNGQNYKLTQDNGSPKFVDRGTFDDIKSTGLYTCTGNVTGANPNPNYNGYYYLEVIGADTHLGDNNKWITQRATIFEGVGHGVKVYTRVCQNGTWSEWREL